MADVPIGILLSGGLDSSLIATMATRICNTPISTFTISFPDDAEHNEGPIARRLAEELGTNHLELAAEPSHVDLLSRLAIQFDEPIADSSMIPTFLVSKLVRTQATVALGGDGGDELFGGYVNYTLIEQISTLRKFGLHRLGIQPAIEKMLSLGCPARRMILRTLDRYEAPITIPRLMEPQLRNHLLPGASKQEAEKCYSTLVGDRKDLREQMMALDFMTYMCDDVLVKVDRASMLNSLEVRAPLLDHHIVEFAFGRLAPDQRVSGQKKKILLKHVAQRVLPSWFDSTRKLGFSIPLQKWLNGPWRPMVKDLLSSNSNSILDSHATQNFFAHNVGNKRMAHQLYLLVVLELWRRHYRATL